MTMNEIDNFTSALVNSAYFADLSEYGFSGISINSKSFKANPACGPGLGTAPGTIGLPDMQNFIDCEVNSNFVPTGPEFIYNIFLPRTTTEVDLGGGLTACAAGEYDAYHFHGTDPKGPVFTAIFANPACVRLPGVSSFGSLVENLSHELVEAITDPYPTAGAIVPEIADLCSATVPFLSPFGGAVVSTYFSNSSRSCAFPTSATTPTITSVLTSGVGHGLQVVIQGTGFGALPRVPLFAANNSSPLTLPALSFYPYLSFADSTSGVNSAGNVLNPDTIRLGLQSWSDTAIEIGPLGSEVGGAAPMAGQAVTVTVCNPSSGICTCPPLSLTCAPATGNIPAGSHIISMVPGTGPVSGGTGITIGGFGFASGLGTRVTFVNGSESYTKQVTASPPGTSLSLSTPPFVPGPATISVLTGGVPSDDTVTFTYCPPFVTGIDQHGPAPAGTTITITGTCFTGANAVHFGSMGIVRDTGMPDSPMKVAADGSHITAVAPGNGNDICYGAYVHVQVRTPDKDVFAESTINDPSDRFSYASSLFCLQNSGTPAMMAATAGWRYMSPFCTQQPQACAPVLVGQGPPVNTQGKGAPVITDLGSSEAEKTAISSLIRQNILELVGPGKFAPSAPLTRAELAVSLNRTLRIPSPQTAVVFTDVELGDASYPLFAKVQPYLSADQGKGGAYTFHPEWSVDRELAVTLAVTMLAGAHRLKVMQDDKEIDATLSQFADAQAILSVLRAYVATGLQAKLIPVAGKNFGASQPITRGEWAQVLWKMQQSLASKSN
jgi:hypothetical protein